MKFLEAEKVDEKTAKRLEKLIEKSYYSYWKKKGAQIIKCKTVDKLLFSM